MSRGSEESARSAETDRSLPERSENKGADGGGGVPSGSPHEPDTGDRLTAPTARSGGRSAPAGGSVLTETPRSGPTSSLLVRLTRDVGEAAIVDRFVTDYLTLLDGRLETLAQLLSRNDADATRLCILSLESSSAMLGADELVDAARELRQAVAASETRRAQSLFAAVTACAIQLRERLSGLGFVNRPVAG